MKGGGRVEGGQSSRSMFIWASTSGRKVEGSILKRQILMDGAAGRKLETPKERTIQERSAAF